MSSSKLSDSDESLTYEELLPYKCRKCSNRFKTQKDIDFHYGLVHSGGIFSCASCNYSSREVGKVAVHNYIHIREKRHFKKLKPAVHKPKKPKDPDVRYYLTAGPSGVNSNNKKYYTRSTKNKTHIESTHLVNNNNVSGDSLDADGENIDVFPTASNSVTTASSSNKTHESHQPLPKK